MRSFPIRQHRCRHADPHAPSPLGVTGGARKRGPAEGRLPVREADRAKSARGRRALAGAHAGGEGEQGGEADLGMCGPEGEVRRVLVAQAVSCKGCSLSVQEDLLNKYAKDMVNYCTATSNNSLQDALDSSVFLVNEKEYQILQLENKVDSVCLELSDYKEKHIANDTAHGKILGDEKCNSWKYSTVSWFMLILFVARIMIPTK